MAEPSQFDKFARKNCDIKHNDKCIDVIYGIKSGKSQIQAMRYPKENWSADSARAHCSDHKGSFEAASEEKDIDMKVERRIAPDTEIRAAEDGKKLIGYAAVFNSLSQNLGGFREKIDPGTFKRSIQSGADIRALFNHDPNFVIGRSVAKTLTVSEDGRGLKVEIVPPDTQWAKDLTASISRGDISQMSFGFRVVKDAWEKKTDENIRTLQDVDLIDVSPVTFPAYPNTAITARSFMKETGLDIDEIEKVFVRVQHKLPLDDKDREVLHRSVETLNKLTIDVGDISNGKADDDKAKDILQKAVTLVAVRQRLASIRDRNL